MLQHKGRHKTKEQTQRQSKGCIHSVLGSSRRPLLRLRWPLPTTMTGSRCCQWPGSQPGHQRAQSGILPTAGPKGTVRRASRGLAQHSRVQGILEGQPRGQERNQEEQQQEEQLEEQQEEGKEEEEGGQAVRGELPVGAEGQARVRVQYTVIVPLPTTPGGAGGTPISCPLRMTSSGQLAPYRKRKLRRRVRSELLGLWWYWQVSCWLWVCSSWV